MTAIDDFITELRQNRISDQDQPIRANVDLFIAALDKIIADIAGAGGGPQINASLASQSITSADTYLTNSRLLLPSTGLVVGMIFEWEWIATKGAVGTGTSSYNVRIGLNGDITDTSFIPLSLATQTAAVDTGHWKLRAVVRTVGQPGTVHLDGHLRHNLLSTGFANTPAGYSAAEATGSFNNDNMANNFIGISLAAGTGGTWSIRNATAKLFTP